MIVKEHPVYCYMHLRFVILLQDLELDLRTKLIGDLQQLVLALMDTKAVYDARCLHTALKGIRTDDTVLIEILCTRTNKVSII